MRLNRSDGPILASVAVITIMLLWPWPGDARTIPRSWLFHELRDFAHPVAMAWLAHLAFVRLRQRKPGPAGAPYLWVLAGAWGYGIGTELLQSLVGRDAAWRDLLNDVMGAGFALLCHASREKSSGRVRKILVTTTMFIAIAIAAPLLRTIAAYTARAARFPILWQEGKFPYEHFAHWQTGQYPGLHVDEPVQEWRGFDQLSIDVENSRAHSLQLVVRVHDRSHDLSHDDRYTGTFELAAKSRQRLTIPTETIRQAPATRFMDMSAIAGVIIFGSASDDEMPFQVHELRLAHQDPDH